MLFNDEEITLINEAYEIFQANEFKQALDNVTNKELVLFIGPTGAGKSTLINYFFGTRYLKMGTDGFDAHAMRIEGATERAKVGQSANESETLYPTVFKVHDKSYALCDFSGFGETRGRLAAISGTGAGHILIQSATKVKNIILVIDSYSIKASRSNGLMDIFVILQNVLGKLDEQKLAAVTFAITKLPSSVDNDKFLSTYIEPKLRQLQDAELQ